MGGQSSKLRSNSNNNNNNNTFLMAEDSLELARLNPEQLEKFRREKQTLCQPHPRRRRRRPIRRTNGGRQQQRLLLKQTSHDTIDLDESTSEHDQDWRMVLWTHKSQQF